MKPVILDDTKSLSTLANDNSNGLGRLGECKNARVIEEANGIYEAEFDIPVTAVHFSDLKVGGIVKIKANEYDADQLFRIYRITKPLKGVCTVSLEHISYDLVKVAVSPFVTTGAANAMVQIKGHMLGTYPFTFGTDISEASKKYSLEVPASARSCIGGREGSFIDTYGGEIHWNNLLCYVMAHRGSDQNVRIAYGKNLIDYRQEVNNQNVYNAVLGYATRDTQTVVGTVQYAVQTSYPKTRIVDFSSSFDMEEEITVAKINEKAAEFIEDNDIGKPDINIDVDFVHLWQTEEYKNVASLERVGLFDTVHVYIPKLDVETTAKVVKTEYDPISERYTKIELGSVRANLGQVMTEELEADIVEAKSSMQTAIDHATSLITGGLGGYVVITRNASGQPQEILVMDTPDTATAVNVVRINKNGIGFSNNGYNGTYRNAWTIDGQLVADFITTGTLDANLIKVGTIADAAGLNYWNMVTGDFRLNGNTQVGTSGDTLDSLFDEIQEDIDGKIQTYYQATDPSLDWVTPSAIKLTFNSQSATENNFDYVDIYYKTTTGYEYIRKTGNIGAAVVNIPKSEFWLYFHSDSSVNNYGFKIDSVVAYTGSSYTTPTGTATSLPSYTPQDKKLTELETPHPYNHSSDFVYHSDYIYTHEGDLWYKTTDHTTWRYTNGVWVEQETDVPQEVFDKIDGKCQVFTATPTTPYNKGDLWFNSSTSDIMTCITARASGSYVSSDWQKRNKYTDNTAVTTLDNNLNQQGIFNRLTNNGQTQGIYLSNSKLYINASYIQTGTLSASRINGGTLTMGGYNDQDGVINMQDSNGNVIGVWDSDGISMTGGELKQTVDSGARWMAIGGAVIEGGINEWWGSGSGKIDLTNNSDWDGTTRPMLQIQHEGNIHINADYNLVFECDAIYVGASKGSDGWYGDYLYEHGLLVAE